MVLDFLGAAFLAGVLVSSGLVNPRRRRFSTRPESTETDAPFGAISFVAAMAQAASMTLANAFRSATPQP